MLDFTQLREACASRNATLSAMLCAEGTLTDFVELQRQRLHRNREKATLMSPEGFFRAAHNHAEKLWGHETADDLEAALRLGALQTADHHGALYSPQSFQGDLLFGQMLKAEGAKAIPLLSFSQVPLGNATFARGLLCFPDAQEPVQVPLYGYLQKNQMPVCTPGYDEARLKWAAKGARKLLPQGKSLDMVMNVLSEFYGNPQALSRKRYADQTSLVGRELYRRALEPLGEPDYCFLEVEALLAELVREDLEHQESILYLLLTDSSLRRDMANVLLPNGASVAAQLFFAPDRKGRHVSLTLEENGMLRGTAMGGELLEFSSEPDDIVCAVENGTLIPCLPIAALLTCWERGLSWFGGIFESLNLPAWQSTFSDLLHRNGFGSLSDAILAQDCRGYISGPIFALHEVEGGAVNAGPLEFLLCPPRGDALATWMDTPIRDTHEMGLFEFYHDLIPPGEREEGWYGCIAAYASHFTENLL